MKHFTLSLGESRFAISLDPACSELLPALYPTARAAAEVASESCDHDLRVRRTELGFEISGRGSSATSAVRRRLADPRLAMLALEEEIEQRVIAGVDRLLALHGGAVASATGTCLILGHSASGKSSTTFQLSELGHACLCEEIALCDPTSWRVSRYPQTLSLSKALIDEFRAEFSIRGRLHRLFSPIVRYEPLDPTAGGSPEDPVTRILLPRFMVGETTRAELISPEEALPEILGYSFQPNVDTEAQFDRVIDLLQRVETTRFVYTSATAARGALRELFSG